MNEEIKALIEREAEKYSDSEWGKVAEGAYYTSESLYEFCKEDYAKGFGDALSLFEWRKVEEELPEFNGVGNEYPILVRKADNTLNVFWVFTESMEFLEFNNVVEWMPIPQ